MSRRRVVRFGEEQVRALRAQSQSFKDHADALCDEASKHKGDWRQMLETLATTRRQIASERSGNAREYAEQSEQRARDIDDEEERHKREAKEAAQQLELFGSEKNIYDYAGSLKPQELREFVGNVKKEDYEIEK